MRSLRFHPAAAQEAEAAASWYEQQRSGLGEDFARALGAALDLLEEGLVSGTPLPGSLGTRGLRRVILKRFPYDVVFAPRDDAVLIVAFAHHSRRPGFWKDRLRG